MAKEDVVERHWVVEAIFEEQKQRKWSDKRLAEVTEETTGFAIPEGTIKHWRHGKSTPRVEEAEALAKAVGWEMELLKIQPVSEEEQQET